MKNFCVSIFTLLAFTACSTMEFNTTGKEIFRVGTHSGSDSLISVEKTRDFYFWGMTPEKPEFNLQDETQGSGLYNPSYVSIEQTFAFSDVLYTLITLGLYCPVTYKVTFLSKGTSK
jgi:hypothetical protein